MSLVGAHRSSSSRKAIHRPDASSSPAFLAAAIPPDFGRRISDIRGSEENHPDGTSLEPSSTTITSTSTSRCCKAHWTARCAAAHRSLVGITTETVGTRAPELRLIMRTPWLQRDLVRLWRRIGSLGSAGRIVGKSVEPISRSFGYDRGTPIDRHYIESFLELNRHHI